MGQVGDSTHLQCDVSANPAASVVWIKDTFFPVDLTESRFRLIRKLVFSHLSLWKEYSQWIILGYNSSIQKLSPLTFSSDWNTDMITNQWTKIFTRSQIRHFHIAAIDFFGFWLKRRQLRFAVPWDLEAWKMPHSHALESLKNCFSGKFFKRLIRG